MHHAGLARLRRGAGPDHGVFVLEARVVVFTIFDSFFAGAAAGAAVAVLLVGAGGGVRANAAQEHATTIRARASHERRSS